MALIKKNSYHTSPSIIPKWVVRLKIIKLENMTKMWCLSIIPAEDFKSSKNKSAFIFNFDSFLSLLPYYIIIIILLCLEDTLTSATDLSLLIITHASIQVLSEPKQNTANIIMRKKVPF